MRDQPTSETFKTNPSQLWVKSRSFDVPCHSRSLALGICPISAFRPRMTVRVPTLGYSMPTFPAPTLEQMPPLKHFPNTLSNAPLDIDFIPMHNDPSLGGPPGLVWRGRGRHHGVRGTGAADVSAGRTAVLYLCVGQVVAWRGKSLHVQWEPCHRRPVLST